MTGKVVNMMGAALESYTSGTTFREFQNTTEVKIDKLAERSAAMTTEIATKTKSL